MGKRWAEEEIPKRRQHAHESRANQNDVPSRAHPTRRTHLCQALQNEIPQHVIDQFRLDLSSKDAGGLLLLLVGLDEGLRLLRRLLREVEHLDGVVVPVAVAPLFLLVAGSNKSLRADVAPLVNLLP